MKDYIQYIDSISVDTVLHERILEQAARRTAPQFRNKVRFRYAGIAACVVVLLLCVWTAPGLLSGLGAPDAPGNGSALPGIPQDGGHSGGAVVSDPSAPSNPSAAPPLLYPLTLNNADGQMSANIHIPGHFWRDMTGEQIKAVLPEFAFPLAATVHYRGDGSIFNIAAYEVSSLGDAARYDSLYMQTEIVLAPGEVVEDIIYEYEPVVSDVYGIPVVAGVFDFEENDGLALYIASFKIDDIAYNIKVHDDDNAENGRSRLTGIVNAIIGNGAPDLSVLNNPVIPELRDDKLTLEQAYADPDFGAYLPQRVPSGFDFESAVRFINQEENSLSAFWYTGYDSISWRISKPSEYDYGLIVSASEREKYDLSLYPVPRADSVPDRLREYVDNPVFRSEELSLDIISARAYQLDDQGDTPGWRMNFSVLYNDVIVKVNAKGLSPEQVLEMLILQTV